VFKTLKSWITHLTLFIEEADSILLTEFPNCPELRHVELPYPVLKDAAELLPVIYRSPNLRHLSISHLRVATTGPQDRGKADPSLYHEPLDHLDLSYINDAKFLHTLVSSIPTRSLTILFESENHALDLRNITNTPFTDSSVMGRKSKYFTALHLERSERKVERSTIEERNVALEALRGHCIRSKVELIYDFPVSLLYIFFLGGWLIIIL
jgi:hypothetical protein